MRRETTRGAWVRRGRPNQETAYVVSVLSMVTRRGSQGYCSHSRPSTATVVLVVTVQRLGEVIRDRTPSLVMISVSIGGLYAEGAVVLLALPGHSGYLRQHAVSTRSARGRHAVGTWSAPG